MPSQKYYAVQRGANPGVYLSWDECKEQVNGVTGAIFKKFHKLEEAEAFVKSTKGYAEDFLSEELPDVEVSPFRVLAYVDGSYNGEENMCGAGVVLVDNQTKSEIYRIKKTLPNDGMNNVAGEIQAVIEAINYCKKYDFHNLTIFYDYTGIENWAMGNWKCNKPQTKSYAQFVQGAMKTLDIKFVKVKAHSGDKYNDIADLLAKEASGIFSTERS